MTTPPRTILVAMSGGVDSSVAAQRLVDAGHRVIGVFMRNGVRADPNRAAHKQGCCGIDDAHDARRVADQLGIPFYAVNLAEAFDGLIDEFVAAYRAGRTPNPCIECNRRFKFGRLLKLADELGADAVATGHYARVVTRGGRHAVAVAADTAKDQTYVLYPLGQHALARAVFPLAESVKADVRAEARARGLRTADKPESMEICFVPTGDYRDLLRQRAPDAFVAGDLVDEDGSVIGRHEGIANFTIGQRRGLPGGSAAPRYVTGLDAATATVVVGSRDDLGSDVITVNDVECSGIAPAFAGSVSGRVKIRHQHAAVPASVRCTGDAAVEIRLVGRVDAVTPGQAAVFYSDDGVVLLGGRIVEGRSVL